jgi:putative membrane protein
VAAADSAAAALPGIGDEMNSILTDEERKRLQALVAEVERGTAGELVTVVARQSAAYGAFRLGWAAMLALLLAVVVHLAVPSIPANWLLGAEGPVGLCLWWLLGWPVLLRRITPRAVQRRAVSDRVKELFLELGVTETRDRSGVLVYLSELERRVEILADRGIHEHVGTEAWQAMVSELVGAIQSGRAAEGLATIIRRIGQELAAKFPPRPDDSNELPDQVVTDRRYD